MADIKSCIINDQFKCKEMYQLKDRDWQNGLKYNPTVCCLQETHFWPKGINAGIGSVILIIFHAKHIVNTQDLFEWMKQ